MKLGTVEIFTGGCMGTHNIDHENGLTEFEAGSYVFMDTAYFAIGGKDNEKSYTDFAGAPTTGRTTVIGITRLSASGSWMSGR